jgi:glycogen synthase
MRGNITHTFMTPATRPPTVLDGKATAKAALQSQLGWEKQPRRAMLCLPAGMSDDLGGELLEGLMPGLLTLPLQIVVAGKGSPAYGAYFTKLAKEKPHKVAIVDAASVDGVLAASDMALFCAAGSEDDLRACLAHGTVPVAPASSQLANYDPNQEAGNAFTYDQPTLWHAFAAAVRAMETYRFPYDWKTIQKNAVAMSDEDREEEND